MDHKEWYGSDNQRKQHHKVIKATVKKEARGEKYKAVNKAYQAASAASKSEALRKKMASKRRQSSGVAEGVEHRMNDYGRWESTR